MSALAFFGNATGSIYTYDGNGVAYLFHDEPPPRWFVTLELCKHAVARARAVVDDFGDLVPVSATLDWDMQRASEPAEIPL